MKKTPLKMLVFACAASVALVACGSDSDSSTTTGDQTTTSDEQGITTVGNPGSVVTPDVADPATTADGADTTVSASTDSSENAAGSDALVSFADTGSFGDIAVNSEGMTLYGFVPDLDAKKVTCEGGCATAWPPVTVPSAELPEGLNADLFSVVDGPNGFQLQIADVPLYLFQSDSAPGDAKGQGSGSSWYVVGPDGSLIK